MAVQNVTSEWKECRDSISRFDGYLFRLRLSVFTVFSLALSGLIGSSTIKEVDIILQNASIVLFIFATLSTYVLSIYILDRYYERMLMIAVYRASYIETFRLENFKIGLTTEIEFQKEQILKGIKKKNFFTRIGFKGSEMVNIIYIFLYFLVSVFCLSLIYSSRGLRSNDILIYLAIFFGFVLLGVFANTFLVEPKKLIKLRSQAVNSPIVVSKEEIIIIVNKISEQIKDTYKNEAITIVSILNGARPFTNDLMSRLSELGVRFDLHLIRIESTKDNQHLSNIEFIFGENNDFHNKNVLIVDDLIDTGSTIMAVKKNIVKSTPKSIKLCTLLNKFSDTELKADFVGLNLGLLRTNFPLASGVKDYWMFGYGMDLNEQFRDLDFIGWIEKR